MKPALTILIYFGSEISLRKTPFLSSLNGNEAIVRAEVESSLTHAFCFDFEVSYCYRENVFYHWFIKKVCEKNVMPVSGTIYLLQQYATTYST